MVGESKPSTNVSQRVITVLSEHLTGIWIWKCLRRQRVLQNGIQTRHCFLPFGKTWSRFVVKLAVAAVSTGTAFRATNQNVEFTGFLFDITSSVLIYR